MQSFKLCIDYIATLRYAPGPPPLTWVCKALFLKLNTPPAGGENIREIIRQTGAHVELDRNPPPNMTDKLFKIRGNPGQIQAAISMIQEKTGQQGGPDFNQGHGPVGGGMMGGPGGPNGGPPGGPGGPGPQGPGGFDQFGGQFGQK